MPTGPCSSYLESTCLLVAKHLHTLKLVYTLTPKKLYCTYLHNTSFDNEVSTFLKALKRTTTHISTGQLKRYMLTQAF